MPVDSIVGIFEEGNDGSEDGFDEFTSGLEYTVGSTLGVISSSFVQNWISSDEDSNEGPVVRASRIASTE